MRVKNKGATQQIGRRRAIACFKKIEKKALDLSLVPTQYLPHF
jgi:hypothetical protein